jgi:hypothetical protein
MAVMSYWIIKFLFCLVFIFSAYSIANPRLMLRFFLKKFEWKIKWFGLEGKVTAGPNALKATRYWSAVIALIFAAMIYWLCRLITVGCVMK